VSIRPFWRHSQISAPVITFRRPTSGTGRSTRRKVGLSERSPTFQSERYMNHGKTVQSNLGRGGVASPCGRSALIAAAHNRLAVFARWRQCARVSNTIPLAHRTHHPKRQIFRFRRFCTIYAAFSLYVTCTLRHSIPPPKKKICPFQRRGSEPYLMHGPVHFPNHHH